MYWNDLDKAEFLILSYVIHISKLHMLYLLLKSLSISEGNSQKRFNINNLSSKLHIELISQLKKWILAFFQ